MSQKFRSGFEKTVAEVLNNSSIEYEYEPDKFKYVVEHHYCPDFKIGANKYLEVKGNFRTASDRTKLLKVREQNPELEIVLVFQNPNLPISKGSKTTYRMWAEKNGLRWCTRDTLKDTI